ncbi:MAG: rhomboid family intramembrane serine protease [Syntrophaceae bacterium]|nr:rhomboid family intramembrane serine protease [Syntrophaceae bacterium]
MNEIQPIQQTATRNRPGGQASTTTALAAIGAWFIEQTVLGLITHFTGLKSYLPIAFWAHIGGLAAGILIGLLFVSLGFRKKYPKKSRRHLIFGYA